MESYSPARERNRALSEKVLFPASRFDHQDTIFCLKIILTR